MGVSYRLVGLFSLALQVACIPAWSASGSKQKTLNILLEIRGALSVTTSLLPSTPFCLKLAEMGKGRLLHSDDWVEGNSQRSGQ